MKRGKSYIIMVCDRKARIDRRLSVGVVKTECKGLEVQMRYDLKSQWMRCYVARQDTTDERTNREVFITSAWSRFS